MVANYGFEIIADSIGPSGKRLTTGVARMPRIILAEWNTHRMFSRNAASSRAIPVEKMIQRILGDPFIPLVWGSNKPGMQAGEELLGPAQAASELCWLHARDEAVANAYFLHGLGLHKQTINRLLEPWMFTEVITSSTEWGNFFRQRCDSAAEPHMQKVAYAVREEMEKSEPQELCEYHWHLPYLSESDKDEIAFQDKTRLQWPSGDARDVAFCKVSSARCARVSYFNHEGKKEWRKDLALAENLIGPGHWSPFEHVAQAMPRDTRHANFVGFQQFRERVDHHNYIVRLPAEVVATENK